MYSPILASYFLYLFGTCQSDSLGTICPCLGVSSIINQWDSDNALSALLRHSDISLQAMVINANPSTQQHTIVLVCIVAPVFSSLFAAIRVWTRIFILRSIGWDDCKLPHHSHLKTSLSLNTDAAIITLVMLTPAFAHCSLLMRSKQPFCIAFSVLVGLGMLVAPRVKTSCSPSSRNELWLWLAHCGHST